jgi:hypothetical protein
MVVMVDLAAMAEIAINAVDGARIMDSIKPDTVHYSFS